VKGKKAPIHLDAASAQYAGVLIELSRLPVTIANIKANHTRTADGYCAARECARGGYGTPATPHPCSTRVLADSAARIAAHRTRPDPGAHES
jgi:hypothetical protein